MNFYNPKIEDRLKKFPFVCEAHNAVIDELNVFAKILMPKLEKLGDDGAAKLHIAEIESIGRGLADATKILRIANDMACRMEAKLKENKNAKTS